MFAAHDPNSTKRSRGRGTLRLRKDGLWELRVTLATGKLKSFYGKTPEEVERKMRLSKGDPLPEDLIDIEGDSVYFVQAATGGPIKIGTANDVRRRVKELQMCCPVPLRIIHYIPGGGRYLEGKLHKAFALHRLHGEWFDASRELLDYIRQSQQALETGERQG